MNSIESSAPSAAPLPAAHPEPSTISPALVWALCIVLTPLCGAVLYYAWRRRHPAAARHANRASWVSFVLWLGVGLFNSGVFGSAPSIGWRCSPKDADTFACAFDAHDGRASACFDLILTCDKRRHAAHVCSGPVDDKQSRTVDVDLASFSPPVDPSSRGCEMSDEHAHVE